MVGRAGRQPRVVLRAAHGEMVKALEGVVREARQFMRCQFTSTEFTAPLLALGIKLSMDGKGRCLDNVFVERLWRTVKYEEVYLRCYE